MNLKLLPRKGKGKRGFV